MTLLRIINQWLVESKSSAPTFKSNYFAHCTSMQDNWSRNFATVCIVSRLREVNYIHVAPNVFSLAVNQIYDKIILVRFLSWKRRGNKWGWKCSANTKVCGLRIEFGAKHGGFISLSRFVVSGVDKEWKGGGGTIQGLLVSCECDWPLPWLLTKNHSPLLFCKRSSNIIFSAINQQKITKSVT